jgi:DNA-directed RNA polymerase subunit alpha
LVKKTEDEMLGFKNFGKKSLTEIKELLVGMGLTLGMQIDPKKIKKA